MTSTLKIRRVFVAILMLTAAAFSASPVFAHAKLQSSQPANGETLEKPPTAITLVFSTPLQKTDINLISVADRGGVRFDKQIVTVADDLKTMSVELENLAAGEYAVEWKALSADDHLMKGSFKFSVAENKTPQIAPVVSIDEATPVAENETPPPAQQTGMTPMQSVIRWLTYLALMMLFGGLAFLLLVFAPSVKSATDLSEDEKKSAFEQGGKRFVNLTLLSLTLFLSAALAALALQTASLADTGIAQALTAANVRRVLMQTAFGTMWFVQIGAAVALLAVFFFIKRRSASKAAMFLWLGLLLSAVLMATLSFTGHARAAQAQHRFAILSDWLHLVAAGVWVGGIFYLILMLPRSVREFEPSKRLAIYSRVVPRFSNLAVVCVGALTLTGIYNSWVHLRAFSDFVSMPYGITLLVKIILFALLVALGGFNKFVLRPRIAGRAGEANQSREGTGAIKDFYFVMGIEAAFAVVVLLLTAIIAFLPHSQHHAALLDNEIKFERAAK